MQIVIDIPEEIINMCKDNKVTTVKLSAEYFRNGTPLPKGHGRLIDADRLPLNDIDNANYGSNYIRIAPTVLEADKENT